jgi:hypothetical protein
VADTTVSSVSDLIRVGMKKYDRVAVATAVHDRQK